MIGRVHTPPRSIQKRVFVDRAVLHDDLEIVLRIGHQVEVFQRIALNEQQVGGSGGALPCQPTQDRLVSFLRLFLLNPMAAIEADYVHIGHEVC